MKDFENSQQAVEAGKTLTLEDAVFLVGRMNQNRDVAKIFGNGGLLLDRAVKAAHASQFDREALEVSKFQAMLIPTKEVL